MPEDFLDNPEKYLSAEPIEDESEPVVPAAAEGGEAEAPKFEVVDDEEEEVQEAPPPPAAPVIPKATEVVLTEEDGVGKMFVGKPVSELIKSYEHAQRLINEQGRARNDAEIRARALEEAIAMIREEKAARAAQAPAPAPADPFDEVDAEQILRNPKGVLSRVAEVAAAPLKAEIEALRRQREADLEAAQRQAAERQDYETQRTLHGAAEAARKELGIDPEAWKHFVNTAATHIVDHPNMGMRPDSYVEVYRSLPKLLGYNVPETPPVQPQAAPQLGNPPIGGRPKAAAPRGDGGSKLPTLSRERLEQVKMMAKEMGIDANELAARVATKGANS